MTREQKIEAFTMKLDGYTLKEIGNHFGLPRERIRSMFAAVTTESGIVRKNYVYPNIARWMVLNGINQTWFARKLGVSSKSISFCLTGRTDPSYRFVNLVLQETGMTYEEAFKREDPNEKTNP